MKNKLKQKPNFTLLNYMTDIMENFCKKNGLEHRSADEIRWKTQKQKEYIDRFLDIYYQVEERDCLIWQKNKNRG